MNYPNLYDIELDRERSRLPQAIKVEPVRPVRNPKRKPVRLHPPVLVSLREAVIR